MTHSQSTRIALSALVALAIGVAGCSSSPSPSPSSSSSSAAAETTTAPPETSTTSASDAALQAVLLSTTDVGAPFTTGTYTPADVTQPLPCGQANPDKANPPGAQVGAEFVDGQTAAFDEQISDYGTPAATDASFAAGTAGFTCATGNFGSGTNTLPIGITGPTDVTSQVGGTKAEEFTLSSSQVKGVLVFVETGHDIVAFSLQADGTADTSGLPDTLALAAKGMTKFTSSGIGV